MAELVDALDLGSSDFCRVGSSPSARTMKCMKIFENKKTDLDIDWDVTIPANLINIELCQKYLFYINISVKIYLLLKQLFPP